MSIFNGIITFIAAIVSGVVLLFTGDPTPHAEPAVLPAAVVVAVAPQVQQGSPTVVPSSVPTQNKAPSPIYIQNKPRSITLLQEPDALTVSSGAALSASRGYVDDQIQTLHNSLIQEILKNSSAQNSSISQYTTNFAPAQRIDRLANVTISNATVNGVTGLTAADIPTNITASNYLPLSGGTLTGLSIFSNGFLSTASTTINGNATTTGTSYATIASSTSLYGAGLSNCNSGNALTWATGAFGCSVQNSLSTPFTVGSAQNVHAGDIVSLFADGTVGRSADNVSIFLGTSTSPVSGTVTPALSTLDSTHYALAYADNTNLTKTTVQVCGTSGTDVTCGASVVATSSTNAPKITTLDPTHFALFYSDSTSVSKLSVQACSSSGTTVSCGVGLMATSSNVNDGMNFATLDTTHIALTYGDSTNGGKISTQICSISGTTVTCGTGLVATTSVSTSSTLVPFISVLDATHFTLSYGDSFAASALTVQACSTVGNVVTCGTAVRASSSANGANTFQVSTVDSTHIALAYGDTTNSNKLTTQICSTSGNIVTCGTPTVASNGVDSTTPSLAVITTLDSTHVALLYKDTSNASKLVAQACSISGNVITCDVPTTVTNVNAFGSGVLNIDTLDSTHFVITYRAGIATTRPSVQACSVSGTTVTCAGAVAIVNSATTPNMTVLDSTHFALSYLDSSRGSVSMTLVGNFVSMNVGGIGIGIATAAGTAGQAISAIFSGIVSGFSNLSVGSRYYANLDGSVSTTTTANPLGLALSGTQLLLNNAFGDNIQNSVTQFFGDAVFANDFRITEGFYSSHSLDFMNQLGSKIMSIDENGNLTIPNGLSAQSISVDGLVLTKGDLGFLASTTSSDELTSTATTSESSAWVGSFAYASDTLRSALSYLSGAVIHVFTEPIYAAVGIFEKIFAKEVQTDKLCVGSACVTQTQFLAMIANVGSSGGGASGTSTPDTIGPVITLNGDNPATITVGATYIDQGATVTDNVDHNLGYKVSLDNASSTDPSAFVLDTSVAATHTIVYSATDQSGNGGLTTRTVVVQ